MNTIDLVGECGFIEADYPNLFVPDRLWMITPRPTEIDGRWLSYVLAWQPVKSRIAEAATGTSGSMKNISKSSFVAIEIALPPVVEQTAIAEALRELDALIDSHERLLTKKRHVRQGVMQNLLLGIQRLPGFSGDWETARIGRLLTICHGKSQHGIQIADGKYPILATGGQIGRTNRWLYDQPSVLIGRKGTIDQPGYVEKPFWSVDTLFYSVVHQPNIAKFLFYRFCLIDWKRYNEASGVPSLNARTIESIEIACPGSTEQQEIAHVLSAFDDEVTAIEAKLAKARAIKQGLMQELLTGRIRLV